MYLKSALVIVTLCAAVLAAPTKKNEASTGCKPLYSGTLVTYMNKPTKEFNVVFTKKPVDKFGYKMLVYHEGKTQPAHKVTFTECAAVRHWVGNQSESYESFGRLEVDEQPGTCITHLDPNDMREVALGLASCEDITSDKGKHQWFASNLDRKANSVDLSAYVADNKTFYTQWRYEYQDDPQLVGMKVLALTRDPPYRGNYNWLRLKDSKGA